MSQRGARQRSDEFAQQAWWSIQSRLRDFTPHLLIWIDNANLWLDPGVNDRLTNAGAPFVGYADSCLTNEFDLTYAISQRLVTNAHGGAVAYIGNSRFSWIGVGDDFQRNFFAGLPATTAIGMTDDLSKGILDRFRSLPMARSAVLSGRTISDVVYNAGILVVLMLSGLAVGWRVHTGLFEFLGGVALLLLFAFVMAWIGVWLGLTLRTVEVTQQVSFTVLFPLTFLSNAFVPTQTLPWWLRPLAEWNPVSALTAATRHLWGNPNPFAAGGLPAEHPIELTLIWVVVLLAIFAPLGVWRYRSMSR